MAASLRNRVAPAVVVLLLMALASAALGAPSRAAKAQAALAGTMRTPHFIVHYDTRDPFLAKLMADTAEDELRRIARDLDYSPDKTRPFPLYVYPSHIGFIEAGGLETSKFTVGTATNVGDRISVDASGSFADPQQVLAHEITHAVIFRKLGAYVAALPLWVNEGLAKYESREFSDQDDHIAAEAAAEGALMPLSTLERSFPESRTDLAYAESSSAVRYMAKKHGKRAPRVLLDELARTGSFDNAMLEATGRTSGAFAEEWRAEVDRQYYALRAARIAAGVGSVLMAALAVLAYIARRRKMAEAARRWEQEERERRMRGYLWREGGDGNPATWDEG